MQGKSYGVMLSKIISGGQTGADQGALEAAERLGVPTGGFMPKGFRTEDGPRPDLAARFGLVEASTPGYPERTERNIQLADGTAVFAAGSSPGSRLTVRLCRKHGKPCIELPLGAAAEKTAGRLRAWLAAKGIGTLNVAGSRESRAPGIAAYVAHVPGLALEGDGPHGAELYGQGKPR